MTLLERESQLASLHQYAVEAHGRDGRLVLISGEAGVGKSSLVEELQAELPDATWLWGACDGLFTPRPFAPLHDIARQAGGELADVARERGGRDRVFEALLHRVSDAEALQVLAVEDVQWADDATLDVLRLLGKRLRGVPALLLVTFRDDALAPTDPLRVALGELAGQRTTRRIDLPPLTAGAVRRLAAGTPFVPEELHRLTGGNPFFVVEVLRSGDATIPASARDAVLARAAVLGELARHTIELASLAGARVDPSLMTAVSGAELATFDELVAAGLLRPDGESLRFRHELARLAIESSVAAHRRTQGHRALLEQLIAAGDDDVARLAYHAEGAGDAALVTRFAPQAARQAAALGAHRAAVSQYERALRFPSTTQGRELAELYDGYADELALVDRWPQAADARQRAIQVWHDQGDARREGHDYRRLSAVMWRLCRGPESLAAQDRAIELLEPLGADAELARAYSAHAYELWSDDLPAALKMLDRASEIADLLGEPGLRSDVLNSRAFAEFTLRRDWTPLMDEALRLALDAGAEAQAGCAYANAYTYYSAQFRFVEGERFWREGIAYCDDRDITTFSTCLRGHRAIALQDLGRWDDAVKIAERVLVTEASPINLLTSQITLAQIRARRDEGAARDVIDAAVLAADGVDEAEWIAATRVARAEVLWLLGDDDAARADLAVARARVTDLQFTEDAALSVWERRLDITPAPASVLPEPSASEVRGEHAAAAAAWDALGCPYLAGLALLDSGEDALLREAVTRFERLGAVAAVRRTQRRMKDLGLRAIPNGARPSTRDHPLGLTRREDEVLALLCEGLSNDEIAGRLVLSTRTVDHHVSAILGKLGVGSRGAAAAEARRRGLVPAAS